MQCPAGRGPPLAATLRGELVNLGTVEVDDSGVCRVWYPCAGTWGRYGFDGSNEPWGACRDGSQSRKSKAANQ